MGIKSMDLKEVRLVLSDSHLIFDRTQLSDAEESILCDCPIVIYYYCNLLHIGDKS